MNIRQAICIDPQGGYGDFLILSGVLKSYIERYPTQKIYMVRRFYVTNFFLKHPAIESFCIPKSKAKVLVPAYSNGKNQRPYQIMAEFFGLTTPIEEKLYFPELTYDYSINKFIPFLKNKMVVIAPSSFNRRKQIPFFIWEKIVTKLKKNGFFVIQIGERREDYVKGAYSLIGLTKPCQLIPVIQQCNYVITLDSFTMHIAEMLHKPTIVLWGPTQRETFGYDDHLHIYGLNDLGYKCKNYFHCHEIPPEKYCPIKPHCMDNITAELILEKFEQLLK